MKLQDFDFRIWNPEVGVYGVLYGDLTFKGKINKRSVAIIPLESESLEIELFTGFCDKNGKKIYEGDIVRYREQNLLISYERATWYIIDPSIDEDIRVDCGTRLQGILECMKYHQNIDTENQKPSLWGKNPIESSDCGNKSVILYFHFSLYALISGLIIVNPMPFPTL